MPPSPVRVRVVVGDDRAGREAAVRDLLAGVRFVADTSSSAWPFRRHVTPRTAPAAGTIWLRDLHLAFPAGQTAGTRLVLTQSTYQLQRWLDWLDGQANVQIIADAARASLQRSAPEAHAGRGPWSRIEIVDAGSSGPDAHRPHEDEDGGRAPSDLHAAFEAADPHRRLAACRHAVESSPDAPALHLAFASACMELQLLDAASAALDRAIALAPDWEAAHFEQGKLWLRRDDTGRAARAFAAAAERMPHFSTALLNLGGALGELGRRDEALEALQRALALDPRGHTVLNNIGAVHREDGRLDAAADAFRQVIAIAPAFVFGYYNLGHTLFLQGEFARARAAYEEGYARDPQKNPRQACRLAVARCAAGDADAAVELMEELGRGLPAERRREMFDEAASTVAALAALSGMDAAALARVREVISRYSS